MTTFRRHWVAAAAFGANCLMGGALPAAASPNENSVDTAGIAGAVGLAYGDHTLNAGLATALEVDRFTFAAKAGDAIRFLIHSTTGGLDPRLTLLNPVGTAVGTTWCNGAFGPCSAVLDATLGSTGTYTLNVDDVNLDEAGNYQVHLERYPPTLNWVGFGYGIPPVNEALGHTTDMDFLAFDGAAGTNVRVAVRTFSGGLDPRLEIWDPLGVRITDTNCNGAFGPCSVSADLNLTLSGVYKVGLSDVNWDESGNYQLQLSCTFGNCPTTIPVVPEPESWALILAGLAVVGGVARRRATITRGRPLTDS